MRSLQCLFLLSWCAAATVARGQSAAPTAMAVTSGPVSRWFELQPSTLGLRYRFQDNGTAVPDVSQLQHRQQFQGRLKLDRAGRFSISAGLLSGSSFVSSWNNTGLGTGDAATNIRLEQLFGSARPWQGVEAQYGGLFMVRGEATEITTYDNDAFIVGERLTLKRPARFWFDELTVTYGYLGDLTRPNLNKRFHRLTESNYHQFLAVKRIGSRASVSGEYTFYNGAELLRQAVRLEVPRNGVVHSIRFEQYERVDVKPDYGFALSGERSLSRRVSIVAGVDRIDPNYGPLNGDRYTTGSRFFASPSLKLTPEWTLSAFITRAFEDKPVRSNRIRCDLVISYDLTRGMARTGLLR
jgi:hypothetical protein